MFFWQVCNPVFLAKSIIYFTTCLSSEQTEASVVEPDILRLVIVFKNKYFFVLLIYFYRQWNETSDYL